MYIQPYTATALNTSGTPLPRSRLHHASDGGLAGKTKYTRSDSAHKHVFFRRGIVWLKSAQLGAMRLVVAIVCCLACIAIMEQVQAIARASRRAPSAHSWHRPRYKTRPPNIPHPPTASPPPACTQAPPRGHTFSVATSRGARLRINFIK